MSDWQEVDEEGKTYFIHEKYGNILKLSDDSFISMKAKILKLGPFKNADQAKQVLETVDEKINQLVEILNQDLMKQE